jgi:16S rRNA (adenine1518-N6/adenine1519-N6)-dimethyltransferase
MVVTLQLEVVRRLLSNPGEPDYGLLTVLIRAWFEPTGWFRIPASCFFPQPEVDSGTIKLVRRADLTLPGELAETFVAVVKKGFSQRRKMMFKLLKEIWPEELLRHGFKVAKLAEDTRAEMVSVEKFAKLAAVLLGNRS